MNSKTFKYSKKKQKNFAWLFLGISIVGLLTALYMWKWANPVNIKVLVTGVFLVILGLGVFLKYRLAPKKEDEIAITISDEGITALTTPVAKAAGLIEWTDMEDILIYNNILKIAVSRPDKYAARMKNIFVRDTFRKTLQGAIPISRMETTATENELLQALKPHADRNNIHLGFLQNQ